MVLGLIKEVSVNSSNEGEEVVVSWGNYVVVLFKLENVGGGGVTDESGDKCSLKHS